MNILKFKNKIVVDHDLPEVVLRRMEASGWTKGRSANVKSVDKCLKQYGFFFHDQARDFLQEFIGLEFSSLEKNGRTRCFHFDAEKAIARGQDPDWWRIDFSEKLGKNMVIVGEVTGCDITLALSDDGEMYGNSDDMLMKIGGNIDKALSVLFQGGEFEEI